MYKSLWCKTVKRAGVNGFWFLVKKSGVQRWQKVLWANSFQPETSATGLLGVLLVLLCDYQTISCLENPSARIWLLGRNHTQQHQGRGCNLAMNLANILHCMSKWHHIRHTSRVPLSYKTWQQCKYGRYGHQDSSKTLASSLFSNS